MIVACRHVSRRHAPRGRLRRGDGAIGQSAAAGALCHCSHQKPSTATSISTATLRQALADAVVRPHRLAAGDHRADQVLAVQPAAEQHPGDVHADDGAACRSASDLVHLLQPVAAEVVVVRPARRDDGQRQRQQATMASAPAGLWPA